MHDRQSLPAGNRIIDRVVAFATNHTILDNARIVTLARAEKTTEYQRVMTTVDFPVSALLSVVGTLPDGSTAEITSSGSEGFVEIDSALHHPVAMRTSICQFAGDVIRLPIDDFQRALHDNPAFADIVYHAVRLRCFITEQLVLCSVRHPTEQRLARWLLMTTFKLNESMLSVTQDAIAGILGTRRASVTIAARALHAAGGIEYSRGTFTVIDRAALLKRSCPCYEECRSALAEIL